MLYLQADKTHATSTQILSTIHLEGHSARAGQVLTHPLQTTQNQKKYPEKCISGRGMSLLNCSVQTKQKKPFLYKYNFNALTF
jgi:hypothetical protein